MLSSPSASVDAYMETLGGICVLTHHALDVNQIITSVGDDSAGATAVFIGTTRNSFKGGFLIEPRRYSSFQL
jgi:molybdopterin synthase catalytic subunit